MQPILKHSRSLRSIRAGVICAIFFVGGGCTQAAEWFVAPTGDDKAAGSIDAPFATVQRAQESAEPGDTVYLRGGTYKIPDGQIAKIDGPYACITALDKSGTEGSPITYSAYKDEKPVFDCSAVKPEGMRVDAFLVSGSWLHLKGIEVTGVQVTIKEHTQSICFDVTGSHNILEKLSMHDGQANGIYIRRHAADNLVLNCDAWKNCDYTSEDQRGGNTDGFGAHPEKGGTGNVFRGCRAWFNSDDGYDCINSAEPVAYENCWALYNGTNEKGEKLHDGNGFKAGGYGSTPAERMPSPIPRHVVRRCIAVGNRNSGFYANHHPGGGDWFNNTTFGNGANFNFLGRLADNETDVPGTGHIIRNNLSYGRNAAPTNLATEGNEVDHNAFPPETILDATDFAGLDETQLFQPRKPDGSLPDITFMKPEPDSRLVNGGVDVGLPFDGSAPDIGAIEQ